MTLQLKPNSSHFNQCFLIFCSLSLPICYSFRLCGIIPPPLGSLQLSIHSSCWWQIHFTTSWRLCGLQHCGALSSLSMHTGHILSACILTSHMVTAVPSHRGCVVFPVCCGFHAVKILFPYMGPACCLNNKFPAEIYIWLHLCSITFSWTHAPEPL